MRDTLRADLLDPWRRPGVRDISQRALDLHQARLAEMRRSRPALDDQLADDGFTAALLAALWHTAWAANQDGLILFLQILPVLAVADPDTAQAAADTISFFAGTLTDGQRHDLDLLTKIRPEYPDHLRSGWERAARPTRQVQITIPGLALDPPAPAPADPVIGNPADRQVAVQILQAQLWAGNAGDERAIKSLRSAAVRTSSARLRQAIGTRASDIADRLIFAGPGNMAVRTSGPGRRNPALLQHDPHPAPDQGPLPAGVTAQHPDSALGRGCQALRHLHRRGLPGPRWCPAMRRAPRGVPRR